MRKRQLWVLLTGVLLLGLNIACPEWTTVHPQDPQLEHHIGRHWMMSPPAPRAVISRDDMTVSSGFMVIFVIVALRLASYPDRDHDHD